MLRAVAIPERIVAAMLASVREAALADDLPRTVISGFHDVFGIDYATYDELSPDAAFTLAEPQSPSGVEAFRMHAQEHPALIDFRRTGRLTTRRLSDLATQRQLRRTGLWAEVFRPLGIKHQLTLALHVTGQCLIGIAVSRTGNDFSADELTIAELLRVELGRIVAARSDLSPEAFQGAGLTRREAQVLALAARRTSGEIAATLGISVRTVEKHLEHVYEKLGVSSRGAAVAAALTARPSSPPLNRSESPQPA
jgi:DNA-binding CsgD family transcriptional regulator